MYSSNSPERVFEKFYELVGSTYEQQLITRDMVDRYLEVYRRHLGL